MGGDGGTNAVQRAYLRGAGAASTTGDSNTETGVVDALVAKEEAKRAMHYCHLSDQPFNFDNGSIVTCRLGYLYNKETLLEALLQRKHLASRDGGRLGAHIRGLKDVFEVRFQTICEKDKLIPVCPITGRELNGLLVAYALIPGRDGRVNVVSEYGMKQLSESEVFAEYGATMKIQLLPPASVLSDLENALELERKNEKVVKKRKRKRIEQDEIKCDITG